MNTSELLLKIADVLQNDSDLNAWCIARFSKAPTIYLWSDENAPPPEEDYPVICIPKIAQTRGPDRRNVMWQVFIGFGVVNSEITTDGALKTYSGFIQAEQFREYAEAALKKARFAKIDFQGNSGNEGEYPLFVSYTTPTIELINIRRGQ